MTKNKIEFETFDSILNKYEKKFISTGCYLLDLALGGGVLRGSIMNLAGEESSGKSLIGVNMSVNCQRDGGVVVYDDSEGTLDIQRAVKVFGLQADRGFYINSRTVERFYKYLVNFCKYVKDQGTFGLYVLDSLDALYTKMSAEVIERITNEAKDKGIEVEELDLSMREKLDKSSVLSWLFSVICGLLKTVDVTLVVINQTRERIGVVFGEKWDTSGGKALKFYSSQRVYLTEIEKIKEKDVVTGVWVSAFIKKNKVAPPFRKVYFPLYFDRGIDDVEACLEFLKEEKVIDSLTWEGKKFRSKKEWVNAIKEDEKERTKLYELVKNTFSEKYGVE